MRDARQAQLDRLSHGHPDEELIYALEPPPRRFALSLREWSSRAEKGPIGCSIQRAANIGRIV
jgi:hypothetical protein